MTKEEQLSALLSELKPGASYTLDEHQLGKHFPPGAAGGILDDRTRIAAQALRQITTAISHLTERRMRSPLLNGPQRHPVSAPLRARLSIIGPDLDASPARRSTTALAKLF
jgi:hypothetical protein